MIENTMMGAPRVRFAPSPTGHLHVGSVRTALFNWLYARGAGGVFVLRIEDTDRTRSSVEMTRAILEGMTWLGLTWDEGPVHQADGQARHAADARSLLARGAAYRCFCTAEQVAARRAARGEREQAGYDRHCRDLDAGVAARRAEAGEPHALRFHVPPGTTAWEDRVYGAISFANADIEDFVVLRSDGTPVYNLAVVSDDIEMRITHVMRGEDHISNTPKQILLYRAFGRPLPEFAHLPLILGPDGKRLSKRHGATAVGEYQSLGVLPVALVNFLALLGWSPGTDEEVFALDELIARFSLEGINRKSAVFDAQKLLWLNGQHLARLSDEELASRVAAVLEARGTADRADLEARSDWFHALLGLLRPRARTLEEYATQAAPFLARDVTYDAVAAAKHWKQPREAAARLEKLRDRFAGLGTWTVETLEEALRAEAESLGLPAGQLIHPLRVAVTGVAIGPGVFDVVAMLGRDLALQRLDAAITHLRSPAQNAAGEQSA
jgi:glutamyl-tRNA synthetase